jgi:hypothetical protein
LGYEMLAQDLIDDIVAGRQRLFVHPRDSYRVERARRMDETPTPDWHVQYRKGEADHVEWFPTPRTAICYGRCRQAQRRTAFVAMVFCAIRIQSLILANACSIRAVPQRLTIFVCNSVAFTCSPPITRSGDAIEVACVLIDNGCDVHGIGFGSLDDSIAKDHIARVYALWVKPRPHSK